MEQEGPPSWQKTQKHRKEEPNCKKLVTREEKWVTWWSVRAKVDGAEKDHAARSSPQAALRVGDRCRQSFRAKLSLTSGLKVRVSRMSKRSTHVKDCEREHTKDWTRKARSVRLDAAVALFCLIQHSDHPASSYPLQVVRHRSWASDDACLEKHVFGIVLCGNIPFFVSGCTSCDA